MLSLVLAVLLASGSASAESEDFDVRTARTRLVLAGSNELASDGFGRIFRSGDGGASWAFSSSGLPVPLTRRTGATLLAVDPVVGDRVYALLRVPLHSDTVRTELYRSCNGGRSWARMKELPAAADVRSMVVRHDDHPIIEFTGDKRSFEVHDRWPRTSRDDARAAAALQSSAAAEFRLPGTATPSLLDIDQGNIAILYDDGTFVDNADLANRSLRFVPAPGGGYTASFVTPVAITPVGTDLLMADDEIQLRTMPFPFPFFASTYTDIHISSNGNLTLGVPDPFVQDTQETPAFLSDIPVLYSAPPRIAPLWDDWAPDLGGQVLYDAQPTRVTITWYQVSQYFVSPALPDVNTFQVVLDASGVLTLSWAGIQVLDGLTAISPGGPATLYYSDLSLDPPLVVPPASAIYQRFAPEFVTSRIARRFYHCHADQYDQLVMWGGSGYGYPVAGDGGVLQFSVLTQNAVDGLGLSLFDDSATFGSASVLDNIVVGGRLGDFPASPTQNFLLDANTLDLVARQVGHQWGSYVTWDGGFPDDLLDWTGSHWNFHLDTNASDVGGNRWRDNLDGTFTTVECDERYSALDRYLMGLIPESAVPNTFLLTGIIDPGTCTDGFGAPTFCSRDSPPEPAVTATAVRTPVAITQITSAAANGPRNPATAGAPTPLRMAWILVVPPGGTLNPADVTQLDALRTAFDGYFTTATFGAGSIDSSLAAGGPSSGARTGNTLMAVRSAGDVIFDWRNGPTLPRRYALVGSASKLNLSDTAIGIGAEPVLTFVDFERTADVGGVAVSASRPSPYFYEVWGRDCVDAVVVP